MYKSRYRKVNNLMVIIVLLTATIGVSIIADLRNGTASDLDNDNVDATAVIDIISDTNDGLLDYDEDTTPYEVVGDAPLSGTPYAIWDDWPGKLYYDAEKSWYNFDDDLMCWAATASNILQWSGWGGFADANWIFAYFQDHWTDVGGQMEYGWDWWFDGTNPTQGQPGYTGSQVDVAGGNFWPGVDFGLFFRENSKDYHYSSGEALGSIDNYLHDGYGVGLAIYGPGAHAISCWGFTYSSSDPNYYTGIIVTDSDDTKGKVLPKNVHEDHLRYYRVKKSGGRWYLQDYGGSNSWYIGVVSGLGAGPGFAPKVNAGSDKITYEGSTVSFSSSWIIPGGISSLKWDFGDGSTSGSQNPTHIYRDNGVYTVKLEATDAQGDVGTDTLTVTVENVAPSVDAGPDKIGFEGQSISFSGSFSDPGSLDTHTYNWDFGDGSTATGTLTPAHIYADNGIYTVTLTVTDNDGGVSTDTLIVTVNNVAPTVDAGSDQIGDEGSVVSFTGTHFDPGILDTHTYSWDFGDGSPSVLGTTASHIYADNDVYTITLTVTDNDCGVGTDTLTVTVNNVAPTVNAGSDQIGDEGSVVSFTGTHFDPGILDTHTYDWDFGDGSLSFPGTTASHIYADNDVYTITLTVTDNDCGVGTDTLTVTVNNVAPTADAGVNQTVDEGDLVSFSGHHTDPGTADTHTYSWNFGDGSPSATGTSVTYSYADNAIYTVTLTVEDDDGGVGTDTLTVVVNNVAPIADIESVEQPQLFDLEDLTVIMLETVYFDGTANDPGSDDLTFTWDWGDSTAAMTTSYLNDPPSFPVEIHESLEHVYTDPSEYTVTLTVEDDDGGIGLDTLIITVWGPQDLKTDAISNLDSAKVGSKHIDRSIDHIIKFIERSLTEKYWKDATHLDSKYGTSVFCYEFVATMNVEIAQSIFESVVYQLVKADELIVRVALSEAENTPVKLPEFQGKVGNELTKANEYFMKAMEEVEDEDYSKAILYYWKSWDHAQNAIKFANKEYECICWHHGKRKYWYG